MVNSSLLRTISSKMVKIPLHSSSFGPLNLMECPIISSSPIYCSSLATARFLDPVSKTCRIWIGLYLAETLSQPNLFLLKPICLRPLCPSSSFIFSPLPFLLFFFSFPLSFSSLPPSSLPLFFPSYFIGLCFCERSPRAYWVSCFGLRTKEKEKKREKKNRVFYQKTRNEFKALESRVQTLIKMPLVASTMSPTY